MKKRIPSKRMNSNVTETKSSSSSIAVEQDIAGLLTMLVQKLASFEMKLDTVLNRVMSRPLEATRKPSSPASFAERRRESMPLHKAVCASCRQDCEVPFKPTGNRPVYCRDCFSKRKNTGTFNPREESRPREERSFTARLPEKPKMNKSTKPPRKNTPVVKRTNKPVVKKKKTASRK